MQQVPADAPARTSARTRKRRPITVAKRLGGVRGCRGCGGRARPLAAIEVTDVVPQGVVSLAHGWGYDDVVVRMAVASTRPGSNAHVLTGPAGLDLPSGNAASNGIPVTLTPVTR